VAKRPEDLLRIRRSRWSSWTRGGVSLSHCGIVPIAAPACGFSAR
jgi:hypothetical protein